MIYLFIVSVLALILSLGTASFIIVRLLQANNEYNKRALYMVVSTHNKEMEAMYDELMDAIADIDKGYDPELNGDVPKGEPTQEDILQDFSPHDYNVNFEIDEEV